jgi:hypothetical protein
MLNEIHTVFCQDVCPRWPTFKLPSGTTTLDPLMLELRKILWAKKAQELKDGKVKAKDGKVKDAIKQRDAAKNDQCNLSPTFQTAEDRLKSAVMELEAVNAEEVPVFETDWFPTLESGDLMNDEEQHDLRKQLLMLRKKSLSMAASDDGSG